MGIKTKNKDPKSTELQPNDIFINTKTGTIFYKNEKNELFKVQGDNLSTLNTSEQITKQISTLNFSFKITSGFTTEYFLPFNSTAEQDAADVDYRHFILAPFTGKLKKITLGIFSADANPETITVRIYTYKYGTQDKISVFETKPFESVLDIYYETSTAGLVHELNEVVDFSTTVKSVKLTNKNFKESIDYISTNEDVVTLEFSDNFGNVVTAGPAAAQIRSCEIIREESVFHENIDNNNAGVSQVSNIFEVHLDSSDNNFKIRPISDGSNSNFVYFPDINPVKYNFEIKVTNNINEDSIIFINDFELENVAPSVKSPNQPAAVVAGPGDVVYTFEANNGSAEGDNGGLFFVNKDTNGLSDQTTNIGFIDGEGATRDQFASNPFDNGVNNRVEVRSILIDTLTGDPIPELSINNQTGQITLTEFFKGTLDVNVNIAVIDSLDPRLIESGAGFSEGSLGGKFIIHDLRLIVVDGLIVLETSNPDHVINGGNGEVLIDGALVDMFNQTGDNNAGYNNYWTQFPTSVQQDKMANLPVDQVGLFLYSRSARYAAPGKNYYETKKAFALKLDESGLPKIVIYERPITFINIASSDQEHYYYTNNWRKEENGHIFIRDNGVSGTADGIQSNEQVGGNGAFPPQDYSDDFLFNGNLLPLQSVDPNADLFDIDLIATNELYGTGPNGNPGAFKVYNNEGTVTTSIAAAQNRDASTSNDRLMKTYDTIQIGDNVENTYNVLYEVEDDRGREADVIRVFLCKAP